MDLEGIVLAVVLTFLFALLTKDFLDCSHDYLDRMQTYGKNVDRFYIEMGNFFL